MTSLSTLDIADEIGRSEGLRSLFYEDIIRAIPSGRAGGLRPEPVPVSAVPALIPIAGDVGHVD